MQVEARTAELLECVLPFRLGLGRLPSAPELARIELLASELERENPTPNLEGAFDRLAGMWECIFTTSRFVLGLDRIPFVRTSAAYQRVIVDPGCRTGHYFNIAELSRAGAVRCVCGEYASVRPSEVNAVRLDVQYEWFYFVLRGPTAYEGHVAFADGLEAGRHRGGVRLPFRGCGWQSTLYLSDDLRIVRGNEGGMFVMIKR
jgi:hypothetical protein